MENYEGNDALYVRMFGDFSITWNGKQILGRKSAETQFAYLMQLLLHSREAGIQRSQL